MELNFLVASPDQMVHDMRRRRVSTSTAKPLIAGQALHNTARIVYATVTISISFVLPSKNRVQQGVSIYLDLPASMCGKLFFLFCFACLGFAGTINGHTGHAF